MSRIPSCDCGGEWGCYDCGSPLRRKLAPSDHEPNVWGSPDVRQYLDAIRSRTPYTLTFPIGRRGGALLSLGDGNRVEVFMPWEDKRNGLLPFMPMELDPLTIIHDPGRGRAPKPWQLEACREGSCQCDDTATGWKLTRPLIRGLLGLSDAFLAEHGRDLAGVLPCWCLCVATPIFMTEVFYNPEFRFPTRKAARAARAAREGARRCRSRRPTGRWPSRPRSK
jgi:hypothetical protein